eukprot:CAMPEP_0172615844 /NCGR_PEP_ID=MMETSP1068-20121228/62541_1 /TAXON_ID=35684 /ORGANISM="Pseudopedinella elastica, Strain CCMP716" /LENGTH=164 /DNA_ID=CAMNT_0013421111 /DNA_START=325 /DNA_END=816 /DNA_ORIENTATION=+
MSAPLPLAPFPSFRGWAPPELGPRGSLSGQCEEPLSGEHPGRERARDHPLLGAVHNTRTWVGVEERHVGVVLLVELGPRREGGHPPHVAQAPHRRHRVHPHAPVAVLRPLGVSPRAAQQHVLARRAELDRRDESPARRRRRALSPLRPEALEARASDELPRLQT